MLGKEDGQGNIQRSRREYVCAPTHTTNFSTYLKEVTGEKNILCSRQSIDVPVKY